MFCKSILQPCRKASGFLVRHHTSILPTPPRAHKQTKTFKENHISTQTHTIWCFVQSDARSSASIDSADFTRSTRQWKKRDAKKNGERPGGSGSAASADAGHVTHARTQKRRSCFVSLSRAANDGTVWPTAVVFFFFRPSRNTNGIFRETTPPPTIIGTSSLDASAGWRPLRRSVDGAPRANRRETNRRSRRRCIIEHADAGKKPGKTR